MITSIQERPEIEAEGKAVTLMEQAQSIIIVTNEDRETAEEQIQSAKALEDEIFKYLDPPREKAYEDYKYHKKRLDNAIKPVQEARKLFKKKCIEWDQKKERIRREAQRKAEAEARKRAEEETLAAAVQAEQEGDYIAAEAILAEPVEVAPVIVSKTSPAPSRLSAGRTQWYAEGQDIKTLCKAVANGKVPSEYVVFNMPVLNKMAVALKSSMNIPGVKAKSRTI